MNQIEIPSPSDRLSHGFTHAYTRYGGRAKERAVCLAIVDYTIEYIDTNDTNPRFSKSMGCSIHLHVQWSVSVVCFGGPVGSV